MKKTILLIFATGMISIVAFGQDKFDARRNTSDSIEIISNFTGLHFYYKDRPLKAKELKILLQSSEDAYSSYKSARASNTISTILSYAGGFMIGWPIGTAIGGGKPAWALAGIGGGLVAVAIPLSISSNKKMKTAVRQYNAGL